MLDLIMRALKTGNINVKRLACGTGETDTGVWSGVLGPYREGQVRALNWVQKRAAKFANSINEWGWKTLAQRRLIARICAIFKAYIGGRAWKTIGDRLLNPCSLSRDDHNRKIRTRKQRTGVGKYSFVNRTIKSCNQLVAGLLASFPCKLNTFSKRVKNVVTGKGIEVGVECK